MFEEIQVMDKDKVPKGAFFCKFVSPLIWKGARALTPNSISWMNGVRE